MGEPMDGNPKSTIAGVLRRTTLFCDLTDEELGQVIPLCYRETFPQGYLIGQEGCEARGFYLVESGCVSLEMTVRWGPGGTSWQWPMEVVTEGEAFGWSALVKPHILTASMRALVTTEVIAIDGAALRALFIAYPRIGWVVMEETARIISFRLRSARRTAAQSVAVFSHDLKTPLAAVENFNQVILGNYAGPLTADQREMLQRNSQRIQRLLTLLNDLLEAAHIDNGLIAPEFCTTLIGPIIARAVAHTQEAVAAKGITLHVDVPQDRCGIHAAPKRLEQALCHLLNNAIKFTPEGGSVDIHVIERDYGLQVEVLDTGIGVKPQELSLLFGDGYRGQSEDVESPGTGMGLGIAKRIIEAHGGCIWVESPPRGRSHGSCFAFALPRVQPGTGRLWSWWTGDRPPGLDTAGGEAR